MTSGEWTCLISFATAPLTCSERGGSENTQNENIRGLDGDQWFNILLDNGIQILKKLLRDNTCQLDYGYMCI